jgi:hypothetical protein
MTGKAMQYAQPTLNVTIISPNFTVEFKKHHLQAQVAQPETPQE